MTEEPTVEVDVSTPKPASEKKDDSTDSTHEIQQAIVQAKDGKALMQVLSDASRDRHSYGQGHMYKRALKFLETKGLVDPDIGHSWSKLSPEKKLTVINLIKDMKYGSELLSELKVNLLTVTGSKGVVDLTSDNSFVKHMESEGMLVTINSIH